MAGKLGSDFNANQPSDDALVKHGAREMRDIKSRIKAFFTVLFNLETGQLKDNIVSYQKLKTLDPDPTDGAEEKTGNSVTINNKGLVTSIEEVDATVPSIPQRYLYFFDAGRGPDGTAIASTPGTDDDALTVATYSFTVPEDVTRIRVRVQGAGGGGGYNGAGTAYGGGGGALIDALVSVTEGDTFLVWVGQGGSGQDASTAGTNGSMTKFQFDANKRLICYGGATGSDVAAGLQGNHEAIGYLNYLGLLAKDGSSTSGGSSASNYYGAGGDPATSSPPAGSGKNGFVEVTYFTV